jgi:YegS/Rv2252/BmrU family lipid kinase
MRARGSQDVMKTLLVANPRSADGWLGRMWPTLQDRIRQNFGPFDHVFTAGPRDASCLARRAIGEGYEMVVAMGGDGTVSEVINGFFDAEGPLNPEVVLGVIPFGTGGDLKKTLSLSGRVATAAAALRGRRTRRIDVGRMHYVGPEEREKAPSLLHFINIASFGIGGLVDTYVNTHPKFLGGLLSFVVATLRAATGYRNKWLRVTLDGQRSFEIKALNVAVANGRFFGGGMKVAPWARMDDGLFDVVALGDIDVVDIVTRGWRIYSGTHLSHPKVRFDRAAHVRAEPLEAGEVVLLDVDGETPGRLPADFEVLDKALSIKQPG